MIGPWVRRLFVVSALIVAIALPELSPWLGLPRVRGEDRNGDGRTDVWRTYDRDGNLVQVAIDSNFDGRSDVQEFYASGVLQRRESDRNFDNRVDLVEEFDGLSREPVRSVADLDFDGTADRLQLFQQGRAIFSKFAANWLGHHAARSESAPARSEGVSRLARFEDPFSGDLSVRHTRTPAHAFGGGWLAGRFFATSVSAGSIGPVVSSAFSLSHNRLSSFLRFGTPSRGPPSASLLV